MLSTRQRVRIDRGRTTLSLSMTSEFAGTTVAQPAPALISSAHELLRELVAIDTAEPAGNVTAAAERVAAFVKTAGFRTKMSV
jgi:hypothetical protein